MRAIVIALVLLLFIASGCGGDESSSATTQPSQSSAAPAAPRVPPGDPATLPKVPATFDAIAKMLRDRFTEPVVRNVRIGIDDQNGGVSVSLTGEVPTEEIRQAIMNEVAARVEGLKNQDFNLDVAGPIPMLWNFDIPRLEVISAVFSPDLSLTVTRYGSIFETATGRRINRIASGDETQIESVAISPNGKMLATGMNDGQINLWGLPQGEFIKQIKPKDPPTEASRILALAFTHDNKQLAAIYRRHGEIHMFDLATGRSRLIAAHRPNSQSAEDSDEYRMVISPDDRYIATALFDGHSINVFDINARAKKEELEKDNISPEAVVWSHNGKFIAAGRHFRDPDQAAVVIDLETGKSRYFREDNARGNVAGIALSPDDRTMAVFYNDDPSVVLWDIPSGQKWQTMDTSKVSAGLERGIGALFSPDGSVLATVCGSQRPQAGIRLWDVSRRPGSTNPIAQLPPAYGDKVAVRDDRLAQAIDSTIRTPHPSPNLLSLKVQALPDGSVKLTGKTRDPFTKRDAGWTAESLHLSDDPDQNAKRKVINEIQSDTTYPSEPEIIGK